MCIDAFWINEKDRGKGLGSKILKQAEDEAVRRGCKFAHLDSHDFQAIEFYKKNGYEIVGELQELPENHNRYLLKKQLIYNE